MSDSEPLDNGLGFLDNMPSYTIFEEEFLKFWLRDTGFPLETDDGAPETPNQPMIPSSSPKSFFQIRNDVQVLVEDGQTLLILNGRPPIPVEGVTRALPTPCEPAKCKDCDTEFTIRTNLLRHMKQHGHGGYVKVEYRCSDCGKIFGRSDALKNHRQKMHRREEN